MTQSAPPANRPSETPAPLRSVLASLTGFLSAGLIALAAVKSASGEPTTGVVWAFVTLPGLIMPLAYLRASVQTTNAGASPESRLLKHTLLIPILWGLLTVALTCLQAFGIGVFSTFLLFLSPLELPVGAELPATLFWTPLIGGLIRLAGGRTLSPVADQTTQTLMRRGSVLLFLLLGLAFVGDGT